VWVSRQVAVMATAWERGDRVTAAELIARHPELDTEAAIRLIYEEICLRREAGLAVDLDEVIRRFPRWANELRDLLDCDRLLGVPGEGTVFPEVGESLGPFRLIAELGRGASGRTFLASEPMLADRPVVAKVMSSDQDEHLALARLQHTHIIPLFSEHLFPDRGLRVLCMPYLGGASLAQVLAAIEGVEPARWSGRLLVELIDRTTGPAPAPTASDSPFRRSLEQMTYVEAVTWIAACLADGLHYAHARGLVHMDLKPSNVLITADGQPMLLDFHLARGPLRPGDWVFDRVGGTRGWMSPEQEAAVEAAGEARPIAAAVDGRTDIHALGLLLREMLAGPGHADSKADLSLRTLPGVTVGLVDIVRKCLVRDPAHRYADVATLADDLRRHLTDKPLRGVSNRSPAELWHKLSRRRPGLVAWVFALSSIAAALVAAVVVGGTVYRQRVGEASAALDDGCRAREAQSFDQALGVLQRGRAIAARLPAVDDLRQSLDHEIALARRGALAADLHRSADLIRFQHGDDLPAADKARALLRDCQAIWDRRALLPALPGTTLDNTTERQISSDMLELAVVWADLRVRLAPPDQAGDARRDARTRLDEAETEFGPSLALELQRRALEPGSDQKQSTWFEPRSPWDHYELGRFYLRNGRIADADTEFRRTLEHRPQDLWPNFYQGRCAYLLGRHADAVAAFRTAIALAPAAAPCYYNRALALTALGRSKEAYDDDTRAIELDPHLAAAHLNRATLALQSGRPAEALADLEQALSLTTDPATLGRIHLNLALAHKGRGDRASARDEAARAVALGNPDARTLARELNTPPSPLTRPPLRTAN
jgi:serine/threonine protein kinase/tetratricopeptide (TPR) repeat protein